MLDARITIVNGIMKNFDRKSKTVIVKDHLDNHLTLNYDLLIIGVGLVDNTIKDLSREKAARPDLQKEAKEQPKDAKSIEDGTFL
jgi:NADH dehydrogenase FAD-containing subunit